MTNLILQPASNAAARSNYEKTIKTGIALADADIQARLTLQERAELQALAPLGRLRLWGARPGEDNRAKGKWDRIASGDYVLFSFGKGDVSIAKVISKLHNAQLAEYIWGQTRTQNGYAQTWEYIYVVDEPVPRTINLAEFNRSIGRQERASIQEFAVLSPDASAAGLAYLAIDHPSDDPWKNSSKEPSPYDESGTVGAEDRSERGMEQGNTEADVRPKYRDNVEFVADAPSTVDLLNRQALAKVLAHKLYSINAKDPQTSFLVQIDGAWGSGKSTLMTLIQHELDKAWLTVDFNAWKQEGLGPPWWALLSSLRHAYVQRIPSLKRIWMRITEFGHRLHGVGAPYTAAMVLLLVVSIIIFILFHDTTLDTALFTEIAKAIGAILAAGATIWTGLLVASRFLLWDSARGAHQFEQSTERPAQTISAHFAWLARKANTPVVFFIDDLDRCKPAYVVELLEAVQTMLRDAAPASPTRRGQKATRTTPAVYFIIAADGAWVRHSYEKAFADLNAAVSEPGRPLGYLFLDKLFQLRVTMPTMDSSHGREYLKRLLQTGSDSDTERLAQQAQAVRSKLQHSSSTAEDNEILTHADPEVVMQVSGYVLERLTSPEREQETEHSLERFGELLHFNPRSTKRFLNSFSIMQAVAFLEGRIINPDTLALWLILQTRWPGLADELRKHPDALATPTDTRQSASSSVVSGPEREFLALLAHPDVQDVIHYRHGGPLTPDTVRALHNTHPAHKDSDPSLTA